MSKQLLIEEAEFTTPIKIEKGLKESISVENNNDVLIVRNIPATIADRKNQNGRIYTTEVLQEAIRNANFQLKTKWMYSQADEHPEGSFVKPSHASHVVINAYIKKNVKVFVEGKTERHNVMFMDWEILNTEEGKNLKALILQETACPTSIRGLGDMNGEYVTDYELLGCDVVSNPSSGTSMRMPVSESIKVESSDKSYLDESFEVVTVSNDVVSDVEAAAQKQIDIENAKYGTITNIKTKLDQEIDPKTHAETTITSIEATTTDEVSELNQALQMATNAFTNPVSKMDSVTITYIDDAEKAKESTVANAPNSIEQVDTLSEKDDKKEFLDAHATCGDVNVLGSMTKGNPGAGALSSILPGTKEEVEPKKEFLDFGTTEVNGNDTTVNSNNNEENKESQKEFLNADATLGDVNVFGMMTNPKESSEDSIDQTLIDGLADAIKELNDQILKEKDPEKVKKLKMNRDELEKLLNKNKASQQKDSEEKEKKEFLDFGTTEVNGNGSTVNSNNTTTNEEESEQEVKEDLSQDTSNIEVKGNKLSLQLDPNTTIEKEVGSEKDAEIAKAGLDNGKIDPNFMVTEDMQDEQLYDNPDQPSDALVNQPLTDSNNDIVNIVLTDLDYDISDPENITADDEQYLSELPNEVTVRLSMNEIPQEGEVDKFIIANAAQQTGLPIKNAKIKSASVDFLKKSESSLEEAPLWSLGAKVKDFGAGIVNGAKKMWKDYQSNVSPEEVWNATINGKNNFLKGCIDHGVNLNVRKNGITPLMYAATKGMNDTVDVLAKDNKLLNATNMDGNTALILATAYAKNADIVDTLLRNGADINIKNKKGKSVYDYVRNNPEIAGILNQYQEEPIQQEPQNVQQPEVVQPSTISNKVIPTPQAKFNDKLNKLQDILNNAMKLSSELQSSGIKDSVEEPLVEDEKNTYTVYAFLNGQLKDEVEDIVSEDEAIKKAEAFQQQYENQGANFQVIVTKIDDNGFEDFDKLIYQYPEVEFADEPEEFDEPESNGKDYDEILAMYHNAGIDG